MATEFEIVGRREMPGLDASNPRAVKVVIFYRAAGDPNTGKFVLLDLGKDNDAAVTAAIAAKERNAGSPAIRKITIP